MTSYRQRIYEKYVSCHQASSLTFDVAVARQRARPYRYYFRGWLPARVDARIIDLACGGGMLLHFFKDMGYTNLNGVDVSPEQIELARQVVPSIEHASIFDVLAKHNDTFDMITALDIIEHLTKDEVFQLLDGCWRALKPGGRLILQTPNAETPWGFPVRYADFTHEVCFTPQNLARLLELCGYESVEARESGPVPRGNGIKSYLRYLIWRAVRTGLLAYNAIETGNPGSGILTRVFMISATKPAGGK